MILCSKLKNILSEVVTKSKVVTKLRLHCMFKVGKFVKSVNFRTTVKSLWFLLIFLSLFLISGNSILKDGRSIHENYGAVDLDKLDEADRVGVVRTAQGDLVFFVNGISQSVAASELPDKVWAVIDLYGKCAQVTLTTDNCAQEARILSNDLTNEATAAASAHNHVNQISSGNSAQNNLTNSNIAAMTSQSQVCWNLENSWNHWIQNCTITIWRFFFLFS